MSEKIFKKTYSPSEKAAIGLEALKGNLTFNEITKKYGVHASQINRWKSRLKEGVIDIFANNKAKIDNEKEQLIGELYKKIGQLEIERDWLKKNLNYSAEEKKKLIEPGNLKLGINRQCELVGISRAGYYYKPKPIVFEQLQLINLVDETYTKYPFFGTRKMSSYLQRYGYSIGRKGVRKIYEILALEAIYPKPNLSRPKKKHLIYPYLLYDTEINRCNQVWSSDITYIRLKGGFVYLMAIIDWYSRFVLDWELNISLDADFCVDALQRLLKLNVCEIFNTDQGSQFTSHGFIDALLQKGPAGAD